MAVFSLDFHKCLLRALSDCVFLRVMNMIHRICTQQTLVCIQAQTRNCAFSGSPSDISGVFVCKGNAEVMSNPMAIH